MATTGSFDVPTLSSRLDEIRALSSEEIHFLFLQVTPSALVPIVRATPKSNSVDNVRAIQGDATVLEKTIKL